MVYWDRLLVLGTRSVRMAIPEAGAVTPRSSARNGEERSSSGIPE